MCGLLSHTERFCSKKFDMQHQDSAWEWGSWLRSPPRRAAGQEKSRWLRDEKDENWGGNLGSNSYQNQFSEGQAPQKDRDDLYRRDVRTNMHGSAKLAGSSLLIGNSKIQAAKLKNKSYWAPRG